MATHLFKIKRRHNKDQPIPLRPISPTPPNSYNINQPSHERLAPAHPHLPHPFSLLDRPSHSHPVLLELLLQHLPEPANPLTLHHNQRLLLHVPHRLRPIRVLLPAFFPRHLQRRKLQPKIDNCGGCGWGPSYTESAHSDMAGVGVHWAVDVWDSVEGVLGAGVLDAQGQVEQLE